MTGVFSQGRNRGLKSGGTNHGEREERGVEGVECEEEVSPSPPGEECGEMDMYPPQKLFRFWSSKWQVLVHSES